MTAAAITINLCLLMAGAPNARASSPNAASLATPYGVYEIRSLASGRSYRLFVTEEATPLTTPGAFLVEPPKQCRAADSNVVDPLIVPFLRPYWNLGAAVLDARGTNGRFVNTMLAQFSSPDAVSGSFRTTNPRLWPPRDRGDVRPIAFTGKRIEAERDLAKLAATSVVNSPDRSIAQGAYQGFADDGTRIRLDLTVDVQQEMEHWDASFYFARHEGMALGSYGAQDGLIRMIRLPNLDPRQTSGVTGTVVQNERGELEFHGFYFVIRTGCVHRFVLKRTRPIFSR